jgi:hypothetical protein
MSNPRRRPRCTRRLVLSSSLALASGALILFSGALAGAALANATTKSVVAAATKALAGVPSVHVKVVQTTTSSINTLVADIGKETGRESYSSGAATFTVSVTPKYAYMRGSKDGLIHLLGMSIAQQAKLGAATLVIKTSTTQYANIKRDLTAPALGYLIPYTKYMVTLESKRDSATHGYNLTWTEAATSSAAATSVVMTISPVTLLPIKERTTTADTSSSETTFSRWGKSFTIPTPTSTVPYSKFFNVAG